MSEPAEPPGGVGRSVLRGAVFVAGANWTAQILNLLVGLLVARALGPGAFGIYALALAINEFISIVNMFAIAPAVVQSRQQSQSLFDTAYAMSFGFGVAGFAIAGVVAAVVWQVRSPETALFILALGVVRILLLLTDVAYAKMDRSFMYGPMAAIHLGARTTPNFICLALAWLGYGAWILVLRDVLVAFFPFVLTHWVTRYRYRGELSRADFRQIWSFARPMFFARALDVFVNRFDRLLVGAWLGNTAIGLYDRSRFLAETGLFATQPVMRITLNLFSRLQDDLPRLGRAYEVVNYFMVRVLVGGSATLLLFPEPTMRLLLGVDFLPAAPILRILAVHAALMPLLDNMKVMLMARAKTTESVKLRIGQLVPFVPGVVWFAWRGSADGVAASLFVASLVGIAIATHYNRDIVRGTGRRLYAAPLAALAGCVGLFLAADAAGWVEGAPFWLLPALPPLVCWGLVALLERGALVRELRYLQAQLRGR